MPKYKKPKPTDPKAVYEPLTNISGYDLEGTLDEAVNTLNELRDRYPDKKLRLEWRQHRYSDDYALFVDAVRLETPEEVTERVRAEQSRAKAQADRDRREYDRLTALFGKK